MRLLVIGGTVFLGRALVAEARARGHEITLFNRGVSAAAGELRVALIKGDRNVDVSGLEGRIWDAVVDTFGYFPRQVRSLLATLAGRIGHYTFVSTVSAYADLSRPGLKESDALGILDDADTETVTPQTYGPLKALCEAAAQQAMPEKTLIVRPGIIAGPDDPSDRFSYWVGRTAQGGEVLAAGSPDAPVQMIDVRDLAAWILGMAEAKQAGVFNAVGPVEPLTMQQLLGSCVRAVNPATKITWVDDAFLVAQGLTEWMKVPFYIPAAETRFGGMFAVDGTKALGHALKLRPIAETAADTWRWIQARPAGIAMKAGISREQEVKWLDAWKAASR